MKAALLLIFLLALGLAPVAFAEENSDTFPPITKETRCPVCGMFVAKYPQWITQVRLSDGSSEAFDGVKDMAAYVFAPEKFGARNGATVTDIRVKDYYSQKWIDGRQAFYVVGSKVHGPMGHELIPFDDRDGGENFLKDHGGTQILEFTEITKDLIESLRKGHKMKGHTMKSGPQ